MTVSAAVTVSAGSFNQGSTGATVLVTIDGNGFVNGTAMSASAGITMNNVAFVSSTRVTATFAIDSGATGSQQRITMTNPNGSGGTLPNGFTVNVPMPATMTLAYNSKLRDKINGDDTFLDGNGATDTTITITLSAAGERTVTALQLSN